MKILVCGSKGSGKTTLAKPLAEQLDAVYIRCGKLFTIPEHLNNGKIVVIDKRCENNKKIKKLEPDFVVWVDTVEQKIEKPYQVNYHVTKWFDDTPTQLADVFKTWMARNSVDNLNKV